MEEMLLQTIKSVTEQGGALADTLITEYMRYLWVLAFVKVIAFGGSFAIVFSMLSKGAKFYEAEKSHVGVGVFKLARAATVVGAMLFAYSHADVLVKIMTAPHVYLVEQGIKLIK